MNSDRPRIGMVHIVGAGPGDPGLLTVRGREILESADVVVYDRLVSEEILTLAGTERRIYVGKREGHHTLTQEEINALLVRLASEGLDVCRLKGGDPYVFGRGGEEATHLARHRVPFEVVPGVSSAIAGPACAGIPLTYRGVAASFTCVTAHESPETGGEMVDWGSLARLQGTLVVMMGSQRIGDVAGRLMAAGAPSSRPAAVVQWASLPWQKTVVGTLGDIGERTAEASVGSPAVIVVGDVVALAAETAPASGGPLSGVRIIVTREEAPEGKLSAALASLGARVLTAPAIRALPLDDTSELDRALGSLERAAWTVFASANAVTHTFARLKALGRDARAFAPCRVCAMGPGTGESLRRFGIEPELAPKRFVSEAVAEELAPRLGERSTIYAFGALEGRTVLVEGLRALGHEAIQVPAYRTVPADAAGTAVEALARGEVDWVTFTSSSAARSFVGAAGGAGAFPAATRVACIGPVTAATAEALGLKVTRVADVHSIEGLVQCIIEAHRESAAERTG